MRKIKYPIKQVYVNRPMEMASDIVLGIANQVLDIETDTANGRDTGVSLAIGIHYQDTYEAAGMLLDTIDRLHGKTNSTVNDAKLDAFRPVLEEVRGHLAVHEIHDAWVESDGE